MLELHIPVLLSGSGTQGNSDHHRVRPLTVQCLKICICWGRHCPVFVLLVVVYRRKASLVPVALIVTDPEAKSPS